MRTSTFQTLINYSTWKCRPCLPTMVIHVPIGYRIMAFKAHVHGNKFFTVFYLHIDLLNAIYIFGSCRLLILFNHPNTSMWNLIRIKWWGVPKFEKLFLFLIKLYILQSINKANKRYHWKCYTSSTVPHTYKKNLKWSHFGLSHKPCFSNWTLSDKNLLIRDMYLECTYSIFQW